MYLCISPQNWYIFQMTQHEETVEGPGAKNAAMIELFCWCEGNKLSAENW